VEETINLDAKPVDPVPLSEIERLLAELPPLEGVSLASLTDEDIEFLSGESGLAQEVLKTLRGCSSLEEETKLPMEVFYGFARQGLL
jgi:hypothetical protein